MAKEPKKDTADQPQTEERRTEKEGLMRFGREMTWAFAMALVAIVYVIQAFKIPTGSMENSLLVGDFLLGLKFIYGAPVIPFTHYKFPGISKPKPGDVIIFKYPGIVKKDYIKRCVAGPGQTIEVVRDKLVVDGDTLVAPPDGQYVREGRLADPYNEPLTVNEYFALSEGDTIQITVTDTAQYDTVAVRRRSVILSQGDTVDVNLHGPTVHKGRFLSYGQYLVDQRLTYFKPLHIPKKGETITVIGLPVREFVFLRHLIEQENPGHEVQTVVKMLIDEQPADDRPVYCWARTNRGMTRARVAFRDVPWQSVDEWTKVDDNLNWARREYAGHDVQFVRLLTLDGEVVQKYTVKKDNYFMMGDNRDNSLDSRYWGYLNHNNIKAKAFILYFSWNSYRYCPRCHSDHEPAGRFYDATTDRRCPVCHAYLKSVPFYKRIRFNRIGSLIRSWDGHPDTPRERKALK